MRPLDGILREVPVAAALGFGEVADFRRALNRGEVPAPAGFIGRRPFWRRDQLDALLGPTEQRQEDVEAMVADFQ